MAVTINGSGTVSGLASGTNGIGKILQVVSTTKTDTFTTTSTTFVDITGFTVSITPTSATSKILIVGSLQAAGTTATSAAQLQLMRGSTQISPADTAGSRATGLGQIEIGAPSNAFVPLNYLDSPSTTSATTYKVQIRTNVAATTVYVNRTATDTDSAVYSRAVSTITVMEVAA